MTKTSLTNRASKRGYGQAFLLGLLLTISAVSGWAVKRTNDQRQRGAQEESSKMILKEEHFDKDPAWEEFNNRLTPDPQELSTIVQDFGYSETKFAGEEVGEVGGQVWRCTTPAYYADKIPVKTLKDRLTASGKFAFTSTSGDSGAWFGWFLGEQEPGIVRPRNGLGLNLGFERDGGRLAVRLSNQKNKFCGTFITPYIPGKFRPAPLNANTQYSWKLTYDPDANAGNGRVEFTITSGPMSESAQRRKEKMKALAEQLPANLRARFGPKRHGRPDFDDGETFIIDLPAGFKQDGATFDHFGLRNMAKVGRPVKLYFDDLSYDGKSEDFATDPDWEGSGNRAQLQETMPTGHHDFGFSPKTHFAGGLPGEMGGIFWRLSNAYGYYADRIGPLTLDDPLEARGKLLLKIGTPDSEMCFGWFNSSQREIPKLFKTNGRPQDHLKKTDHFVGIYLAGPSRLGRCLQPAILTAKGSRLIFEEVNAAPRLTPGETYDWSLNYNPAAEDGKGALTVKLGERTATLVVEPNIKEEGAIFDRFGFFASGGGGMVHIYFDDLNYTAARSSR